MPTLPQTFEEFDVSMRQFEANGTSPQKLKRLTDEWSYEMQRLGNDPKLMYQQWRDNQGMQVNATPEQQAAIAEEQPAEEEPGFFAGIGEAFQGKLHDIRRQMDETKAALNRGDISTATAVLEGLGEGISAIGLPLGAAAEKAIEPITEPVIETAKAAAQAFEETEAAKVARGVGLVPPPEAQEQLQENFLRVSEEFEKLDPDTKRELSILGNVIMSGMEISELGAFAKVGGSAIKALGKGLPAAKKAVKETIQQTAKRMKDLKKQLKAGVKSQDAAASIVSSTQKILPKAAQDFKKLSGGKTHGEWLVERGIIATREDTVEQLVKLFSETLEKENKAVAAIGGRFKNKDIKKALDQLIERYSKTDNREGLRIAKKRLKTFEDEGLSMSENLAVKRAYERNVKTGHLKDNISEKIEAATNLDNRIRKFFVSEAEKGGFENIKEFSREIQLSRMLANEIEKKLGRELPNNLFSLTDNLLLVGGVIDPSALAALGLKKALSTEVISSKAAKLLAPKKKAPIKVPEKKIKLKTKQQKLRESAGAAKLLQDKGATAFHGSPAGKLKSFDLSKSGSTQTKKGVIKDVVFFSNKKSVAGNFTGKTIKSKIQGSGGVTKVQINDSNFASAGPDDIVDQALVDTSKKLGFDGIKWNRGSGVKINGKTIPLGKGDEPNIEWVVFDPKKTVKIIK